jgi:SAM-dependent methyltransferase/uncharacterized protein YbaR (Trm112 family)
VRYSLLNYVRCPVCEGALGCFVAREAQTPISPFVAETAPRAPVAGHAFTPAPPGHTALAARLAALAAPAAPSRNREAEIDRGLLVCVECARWFPILDTIPELLPDHLRDASREAAFFEALAAGLPADLHALLRPLSTVPDERDEGAHYKQAEIGIVNKIEDPADFFGPGYSAPFNPGNTEFTLYLLSLFGNVIRLLRLDDKSSQSALVVDSGCGYSWTSEWLSKSGFETIGVDICRAYLEVAVKRIGPSRPHLVVADVENLPLVDGCADGVLAFESFHHIPDRARAFRGYSRALKDGGYVVLAEPGAAHEQANVSVDTMKKYGILEKGMELSDVAEYARDLPFAQPEQQYVLHAPAADLERGIFLPNAWRYSPVHGNIFRIRKDTSLPRRSRADGAAKAERPSTLSTPWQAELQRTIGELRAVTKERDDARADLAVARHTVAMMERSLFWRARELWVRLRKR